MATTWSRVFPVPGWFGAENQGAGVAAADVSGSGRPDLVVFHLDNPGGENHGYYRIGWNVDGTGNVTGGWSSVKPVPGWFGAEDQGAGIAVVDINGDGRPDLVVFHLDNPGGENHGYYRIGWGLDANGNVTGGWSNVKAVPGWFGAQDQGADIAIADVDADGRPELVVFHLDNPGGENHGYYRIGKLDTNGDVSGGWSAVKAVPGWFGAEDQGAGIALARDRGRYHLIVFHIDNPAGENHGYFRIGRNLNAAGDVSGWSDVQPVPGWFGAENQGAAVTVADLNREGHPDLVVFHLDNPGGENHGYYRVGFDFMFEGSIDWPWAIILCRFSDRPLIPQQPDYYIDFFTRNGTGGVADYWASVSFNALDLTRSRVFGWFTMNRASADVMQLRFPADRGQLVQWGIDAAVANNVDLSPFKSILVVHNFGVDHGAAGNGVVIVDQNPALCEFGFISHEMGHGFGLPHSLSANPDMEYGDGWDVMSFATTTFQFPITFRGATGDATVGVNARNLEALGAVPGTRLWAPAAPDFSEQIVLEPLNQPPIGNRGFLIAKIEPASTRPRRLNGSSYTVEFRRRAGWDRAISRDAVLVHEVRSNGLSYLQPGIWGQFTAGQQFVTPDPKVFIQVIAIDAAAATATLHLWDLPEGSLRKETSKPEVYLIENGAKRWVTSPTALFGLGKTWADVRVVPNGGLTSIPNGPDLV